MEFDLSQDQAALGDAARALLDGHAGPERVRAHLESGRSWDDRLWRAMVDQGWLAVAVPEDRGGLGLSWVEAVVLLEEVGRHAAPAPLLPTMLAASCLAETPWGGPLAAGEAVGCVGWSGRSDAVAVRADAGGDRLTGRLDPTVAADGADVAVVWTPDALFAVDLVACGPPRRQPAMDGTRSLAWLTFDDTPAQPVGGPAEAAELLDRAAVGAAAEMLGGASRVLEMSSDYAKERVQFDRPIGSFQAVKHRCADMVVDVEGMRSATWYAAWCIAAGDPDRSVAASSAKVWCGDASKRVMASGLQVHGGIGFTWEHDLHLYLKRAQLDQLSFGGASYHRDRLADLLRARLVSGAPLF